MVCQGGLTRIRFLLMLFSVLFGFWLCGYGFVSEFPVPYLGHLVLFAAVLSMLTLDPYNTVSDFYSSLKHILGERGKLIWAGAGKASTFHWQEQRYNHGFRHCGVNKLPVAQNVMVTVCGRAEWHQSIMCSPWSSLAMGDVPLR